MNIYLAIILYILSIVAGIIAFLAGKNISQRNLSGGAFIHLVFIIQFIIYSTSGTKEQYPPLLRLSFLFTICSGLILCGLALKSNSHPILKIYFSLYLLTILLFFFSPSRLINFLLTAKYSDTTGKIFSLGENYFLEEQTTFRNGDLSIPPYKLIKKHGLFHETIQRNILFSGSLDSIKVMEFVHDKTVLIRGYSGKSTFVSTEIDSSDVSINLVKEKKDQIERRL